MTLEWRTSETNENSNTQTISKIKKHCLRVETQKRHRKSDYFKLAPVHDFLFSAGRLVPTM